ncbi:hypothetical protein FKW77_000382 [Venturia effusa]|uniref:BTB domain-containing protein n=1 Tax=Venturia effusa TaxID=50376 RepID=A0A517LA76_9PEZI|nr:hypothetical protein FKW77_000382 [Venturia effusa]
MAAPAGMQSAASPVNLTTTAMKAKDPRKNEDGTLQLGLKMATIYVGTQDEPFIIHRDLITASSDYFAKALNGGFKEKDGIVRLEDHDPTTFSQYVQWLYNNTVAPGRGKWMSLLEQYILGNYIQDSGYRNTVIDSVIDLTIQIRFWPTDLSCRAWSALPESSPFLSLLVDFWVYLRQPSWYQNEDGSWKDADPTNGAIEMWRRVALGLVKNPVSRSQRGRAEMHLIEIAAKSENEPGGKLSAATNMAISALEIGIGSL